MNLVVYNISIRSPLNPTFAFEPSIQLVLEQVNVDILCHPGAVVTIRGGVGGQTLSRDHLLSMLTTAG